MSKFEDDLKRIAAELARLVKELPKEAPKPPEQTPEEEPSEGDYIQMQKRKHLNL